MTLYGFVVTSHGLRILVGDVRGKGLDAVRMSAQVLAAFRERANDDVELPSRVERLDATVAGRRRPRRTSSPLSSSSSPTTER